MIAPTASPDFTFSASRPFAAIQRLNRSTWHRELADTQLQIAAFALLDRGELLIVDHSSGLYQLIRSARDHSTAAFPRRLSETGLFASTPDHSPAPGVIGYSVNAPGWADGAHVERFLALPNDSQIEHTTSGGWNFPNGAVLVQTLSLDHRSIGGTSARQRIETRLLTRQHGEWAGYSYRWDDDQRDATLVSATGQDAEFHVHDPAAAQGAPRQRRARSHASYRSSPLKAAVSDCS